jgi:hypothetical protein
MKGYGMKEASNRPFDWVAALGLVSGALVMIPSLIALAVALAAVTVAIFW